MALKFDRSKKEGKKLVLETCVPVVFHNKIAVFFMTNDFDLVSAKLKSLGYKEPSEKDFAESRNLEEDGLYKKMISLGAIWAVSSSWNKDFLTYCDKKSGKVLVIEQKKRTLCDEMYHFIEDEDVKSIEMMVRNGFDIEYFICNGVNFLMLASVSNKPNSARTLLKLGANVNATNSQHKTALMYCAENNSIDVAKVLLQEKNIDIEAKDVHGYTALYIAAKTGSAEVLKLLIKKGADLNATCIDGHNPLAISIGHNKNDCAKCLINAGADFNIIFKNRMPIILLAVLCDNLVMLKVLIKLGAYDKLDEGMQICIFSCATRNKSSECLKYLIRTGFIPENVIHTLIFIAVECNRMENMTVLEAGCKNLKLALQTMLCAACFYKNKQILKIIEKWGGDINEISIFDMTPLMCACYVGCKEIVLDLIQHGADVNIAAQDGKTALMYAVSQGSSDIVNLLLINGANTNSVDKNGKSIEEYAQIDIKMDFLEYVINRIPNLVDPPEIDRPDNIPIEHQSFNDRFRWYMKKYFELHPGKKNSDIYKAAGLTKQFFSKMISNKDSSYHPRKDKILFLAGGLKLTINETKDLLQSAGYSFDENYKKDRIIMGLLNEREFNVNKWKDKIFWLTGENLFDKKTYDE